MLKSRHDTLLKIPKKIGITNGMKSAKRLRHEEEDLGDGRPQRKLAFATRMRYTSSVRNIQTCLRNFLAILVMINFHTLLSRFAGISQCVSDPCASSTCGNGNMCDRNDDTWYTCNIDRQVWPASTTKLKKETEAWILKSGCNAWLSIISLDSPSLATTWLTTVLNSCNHTFAFLSVHVLQTAPCSWPIFTLAWATCTFTLKSSTTRLSKWFSVYT